MSLDKPTHEQIIGNGGLQVGQKIDAVFAGLPTETVDANAARKTEEEKQFFEDNADQTLSNFWRLLNEWDNATKRTYGEDSAEYQELKADIAPVLEKVKTYRGNILHPQTQKAIRPLHEIWVIYRGCEYDADGGVNQRRREPDREILSAFHATASFNL